ncbi:spermidine synthase [Bordetella sp. 02P26C-1]|uniref:spermidine synthase n=1 Tax=Bordetella sp. 02P26C-1 TaxID=2683195 RepID=UPI00135586DC|nr:fused MFS/spermidine synthase [Bordetella sp. 02P26C-1]MVW77550.1 spermidine synthase [Bordetella sp. 02P26C-1]
MRPTAFCAAALLGFAAIFTPGAHGEPRLLHSEPSQFGQVLVFEENGERCLNFNTMVDFGRQTCMSLDDPDALVFSYTRMMISALYVHPSPKKILIVGLGGATLQKTLARLLPDAVIDTVEIDPAVAEVAQTYFGYQLGPRQRLFIDDGRAYIEKAQRDGQQYDMIMLDAFDVDYVPRHLMTLEFLQTVRGLLAPRGIVVANTFTNSQLYANESATYAAVFGPFFNLKESNRVIIAGTDALPDLDNVAAVARSLQALLKTSGVYEPEALDRFAPPMPAPAGAEVLRDATFTDAQPGE